MCVIQVNKVGLKPTTYYTLTDCNLQNELNLIFVKHNVQQNNYEQNKLNIVMQVKTLNYKNTKI